MLPALALDAPTERVAVNLLRHLEWQYDGFSLVFLFADVGPSLQLADWLDQRLAMQGRALHRHEAKDSFVRHPEAAVDLLVDRLADLSAQPGGVWYAIQRHPGDVQWNRARTLFLARLNERRFLLERDLKRPLVLVLPAHFRAETRAMAPDIWHKRDLSEELRWLPEAVPTSVPVSMEPLATLVAADGSLPAFAEWQRMASASAAEQAFLPTAWTASNELLAAGRPGDAEHVARSALSLARRRAQAKADRSSDRDLSISLDNLGRVAQAQGDWTQAEAVYRESLALRRQLVERLGGTPESLRDLSISLDNLGRVAQAQGDWTQAEAVYRESLALSRQLVERLGGTPESLRDLSVSLNNLGRVAQAQGDWTQAEAVYRESLALRRQLVERLGGTPESLRDLSVSLNNLGRVAQAQGDWTQAEAVYRESLALSRQLVERLGGTPESLDDLAVSLLNVAAIPPGDSAARAEAVDIYRRLRTRFPDTARYGQCLQALSGESRAPQGSATMPAG
ncbi:MAG: tetratricopeptide repeat protein [Candidatus Accumulibacter sp.]|nr:tetratricopeptide repeat protein [Accumulibacter sp.]